MQSGSMVIVVGSVVAGQLSCCLLCMSRPSHCLHPCTSGAWSPATSGAWSPLHSGTDFLTRELLVKYSCHQQEPEPGLEHRVTSDHHMCCAATAGLYCVFSEKIGLQSMSNKNFKLSTLPLKAFSPNNFTLTCTYTTLPCYYLICL